MTSQELLAKIKQAEKSLKDCIGSACMDEAGVCVSLYSYTRVMEAEWKQKAYAKATAEMANGVSATAAQTIMKASDEYKTFLTLQACGESLLEMSRSCRAKGRNDSSEHMMTS